MIPNLISGKLKPYHVNEELKMVGQVDMTDNLRL